MASTHLPLDPAGGSGPRTVRSRVSIGRASVPDAAWRFLISPSLSKGCDTDASMPAARADRRQLPQRHQPVFVRHDLYECPILL
jgi:hypothetical protein